jgi:hypothetical protein
MHLRLYDSPSRNAPSQYTELETMTTIGATSLIFVYMMAVWLVRELAKAHSTIVCLTARQIRRLCDRMKVRS